MIFLSPAKVNLLLNIKSRDPIDGYHYIDSVFDPVSLYDVLDVEITGAPGIIVLDRFRKLSIPADKNIIYKALELMVKKYGIKKGIKVTLYKYIPQGAGLGGGSSNAAAAIMAVNRLLNLKLSKNEMIKTAFKCGSDVPFFIDPVPSRVSGKGDIIRPLKRGAKLWYVIAVHRHIRVATKDAYAWFDSDKKLTKGVSYTKLTYKNRAEKPGLLKNDFESVIYKKFTALGRIKLKLLNFNCIDACLSGSGSAVYALFATKAKARACYSKLKRDRMIGFISMVHSL